MQWKTTSFYSIYSFKELFWLEQNMMNVGSNRTSWLQHYRGYKTRCQYAVHKERRWSHSQNEILFRLPHIVVHRFHIHNYKNIYLAPYFYAPWCNGIMGKVSKTGMNIKRNMSKIWVKNPMHAQLGINFGW